GVGDIALGQPDILRTGPVNIDVEARIIGRLLNTSIGNAGDAANPGEQLIGVGEICVQIGAADLKVDRRRGAEVQDLVDDIRRKKGKCQARKGTGQLFTQRLHVNVSRRM